jgi:hypothetical protein
MPVRWPADTSGVRHHTGNWLSYLALAGVAFTILITAGTFAGPEPIFPDWIIFPLFAFTLAISGFELYRSRKNDIDTARPFAHLQPLARRTLMLLLACMVIVGAVSFFHSGRGTPERHGGNYFLRNHTELIPVSRSEYLRVDRAEERAFSMIAGAFLLVSFGLALADGDPTDSRESRLPRKARLRSS